MFIYYRDGALEKALWDEVERTMMRLFRLRRSERMVGDTETLVNR